MSHIVEAKTKIKNPNADLLKQAVEIVAGQHEGEVTNHYLDWYHRRQNTELALFTSRLHRGMAVQVDKATGELKFVGDFYSVETLAQELQNQVCQTYVSLAAMAAMRQMGYQTQVQDGEAGQVVLTGVQYA